MSSELTYVGSDFKPIRGKYESEAGIQVLYLLQVFQH